MLSLDLTNTPRPYHHSIGYIPPPLNLGPAGQRSEHARGSPPRGRHGPEGLRRRSHGPSSATDSTIRRLRTGSRGRGAPATPSRR